MHPEGVVHSPRFSPNPTQQQQQQQGAGRPQQGMGYNPRNPPVPPNAVNNSGQYPPYSPYSGLGQGLVSGGGMGPGMGPMGQVSRYPSAGFPQPGPPQGMMHQQPLHVNQINSQAMHPSQQQSPAKQQQQPQQQPQQPPQGPYGSPSPLSPLKALSTPGGTPPPPQGRLEVGGYGAMAHQPGGPLGLGQRSMGPRGLAPQPQPPPPQQPPPPPPQGYMGLSPNQRDLAGPLRAPNHAEPQQGMLGGPAQQAQLGGQALPPQLPFQKQQLQQQQQCAPMQQQPPQPLLSLRLQTSPPPLPPPHPHHQPWAPPHQSPPTTQKVPVQQVSPTPYPRGNTAARESPAVEGGGWCGGRER